MFQLLRLGYDDYAILTQTSHWHGNMYDIIEVLLNYWNINPEELNLAFEDLIRTDCNIAEFGLCGCYTISIRKEHLREN